MEAPGVIMTREQDLQITLERLVDALERQYWNNKPPGKYFYSNNVTTAMNAAKRLLETQQEQPVPAPDDVGGPSA